ncbi:DNA-binding MarR family transcriptional regulator [Undibacterium sp. GrIS 1.8]
MKKLTTITTATTPTTDVKPIGIAYLIGRIDHVLNRRLRDSLAVLGLTAPQYTALSVLNAQSQLSNAQLAERSMVSPQSANEMVKTMESRGWIERQPDASHGRIIQISLTESGQSLLKNCDIAVAKLEVAMLAELGADECTALHGQLRKLLRSIGSMMIDPAHM